MKFVKLLLLTLFSYVNTFIIVKSFNLNIKPIIALTLAYITGYALYRGSKFIKRKNIKRYRLQDKLYIFSVVILYLSYQPPFNSVYFIIKHVVFFLLSAYMIIAWVMNMNRGRIYNHTGIKNVIGWIVIVIILIVSFGLFQFIGIKHYSLPPLRGCSYYDDYNNLVYDTQFVGSCPELQNVIEQETVTGNRLSFTVKEQSQKVTLETEISYQYDELNRITDYQIESFYKTHTDEQKDTLESIRYFKMTVANTYEATTFHSVQKAYKNHIQLPDVKEYNEGKLKNVDPVIEEYRSERTDDKGYTIDVDYRQLSEGDDFEFKDLYDGSFIKSDTGDFVYYDINVNASRHRNKYAFKYVGERLWLERRDDRIKKIYMMRNHTLESTYKLNNVYNGVSPILNEGSFYSKHRDRSFYSDRARTVTYYEDDRIELKNQYHPSISLLNHQEYGFKLKHYETKRDFSTLMGYDDAHSHHSIDLEQLYISSFSIHVMRDSSYDPIPYIHQKNPLLFEEQLFLNDE
ncbi:hypothetical protein [Haloplasma contractile]|uniref:Uncharacterized protein n=1 Tax=Haloplasma contractile SSD-17B TaxID=1033810 RepID=U2DTS5_9MOLU|nr:hypothetical protein [Haloplasma contractile]ERJ11867.1 hypothetical protein HLPCO_002107 [Haloplasma contractile SSD-17B]